MQSLRAERGQATIDYVALVAVVAAVLAAGGAATAIAAPGVANAVLGQVRHALCVVGGGPCPAPRSWASVGGANPTTSTAASSNAATVRQRFVSTAFPSSHHPNPKDDA